MRYFLQSVQNRADELDTFDNLIVRNYERRRYSESCGTIEKLEPVYEAYDSVNRSFGYRMEGAWGDWNGWGERIDSLAQSHFPLLGTLPVVMDLSHVKADYLIREIDRSFEAWQRNVYAKVRLSIHAAIRNDPRSQSSH